jgi:hypothetical protein
MNDELNHKEQEDRKQAAGSANPEIRAWHLRRELTTGARENFFDRNKPTDLVENKGSG